MSSGTLAGFPVVDVTATLHDGSFHDVDSSVLAFQIAARMAFREGMRKGAVRLLEPIMKVSLTVGNNAIRSAHIGSGTSLSNSRCIGIRAFTYQYYLCRWR